MERSAARTRALEEELRHLDSVAGPHDRPVKQQCNHFSIREYVAVLQKKNPKLYSLSQNFCKQQHQNEHQNLCPISVTKFRRWNCSSCLDKVNCADRTTSIATVSPKHSGTNSGCSISFVPSVIPTSVHHTRLLTCTQRSSQRNEGVGPALTKSIQECNPRSGSKGVLTAVLDFDPATKESQESPNNIDVTENMSNNASMDVSNLPEIPQIISNRAGNCTKESQEAPNNNDAMENIANDASLDISILHDAPQMILSTSGSGTKVLQGTHDNFDVTVNISSDIPIDDSPEDSQMTSSKEKIVTQNLSGPKSCEMPNEDEGPKPISQLKGIQVCNKGLRQAASKRNARSSSKKKQNRSTGSSDISGLKFRKRKRMRRLSELIENDLTGAPTNSIYVNHARTNDLYESDKGKDLLEVEKDGGIAVSNGRVEEIQSITIQNKTKRSIDDDVDDGSSLMNWMKRTNKKVRTENMDLEQRNVDSSAVSISTPGIPASEISHHDFVPSPWDQSQQEDPAITNVKHGTHDLSQDAPSNSKQRPVMSKGKSTVLLKRKVPATSNAKQNGPKSGSPIVKKNRLKEDRKGQMAPENSQRRLTKVSLGKCASHNVSGTHDQKMATNKKKHKLQMLDKQTDETDEIPMDVVEILARHQHERQLMTDADSLENTHNRPKVAQEDSDQIAAKDGSIDASTDLESNFQESLTSRRKQKILNHASSGTEASIMHLPEGLDTHVSVQAQASGTEIPEEQMQNSLPVHAASITETFQVYPPKLRIPDILVCTEEQQTHSHMDREVTIACVSPTFPQHQDIADVPTRSSGTNRGKKLMWDSFKTATRNPSMSSYGSQFRSGFRDGNSASTHMFGASYNYPTYSPPLEHNTKKAVNPTPLGNQAMDGRRLYNQRIAGQSGLYPRETMPATRLLRLMDSSTVSAFTNRSRMAFEASGSGSSQYMQNQCKASLGTSYLSHPIEKFPLTLEDLSRHQQVQQNLHRPVRPLPRVGVLGSLLQQDIAKLSEHCGAHTGYRPGPGVSQGITAFNANRQENCRALNTGMASARWNALQLGSVISATSPDFSSPRYCDEEQSWTRGRGKAVHPLDKLVRKDICQTNRNPADFTVIGDNNEYMITL